MLVLIVPPTKKALGLGAQRLSEVVGGSKARFDWQECPVAPPQLSACRRRL